MVELVELISQKKPHIVAINEVKPKNGSKRKEQDFVIEHFSIFTTNIDSTNSRGIVIIAHLSISHLVLEVKPDVQFEEVVCSGIKRVTTL